MHRRRIIQTIPMIFAMALLLGPEGAMAQTASKGEAPRLFADIASSTRVYPNADAALTGFALGSIWRPSEKCVHLAGGFLPALDARTERPRI